MKVIIGTDGKKRAAKNGEIIRGGEILCDGNIARDGEVITVPMQMMDNRIVQRAIAAGAQPLGLHRPGYGVFDQDQRNTIENAYRTRDAALVDAWRAGDAAPDAQGDVSDEPPKVIGPADVEAAYAARDRALENAWRS